MRKSSFGQFTGRLSSGPLRVKNDNGGPSRKSTAGSRTPQGKLFTGPSSSRPRTMAPAPSMRASSIGTRNSGIGARGSGIGVRNRTDVPKDPRPITDRGYQHRCIHKLVEFLQDNKYQQPLSTKMLMSPPAKEFFRIFEFIYRHLDPAFKPPGKMEEEVPKIFKMLGYPFIISKSSMQAVGTPHTWPNLLAALNWLIELVKFTMNLDNTNLLDSLIFPPADGEDFDSMADDKIKFDYVAKTYAAFLDGEDEYDLYDDELQKVLEDKYLGQSGGIEAIRNENVRLKEEIELLDQEMGRVDKLQEEQEVMLLDERKFRDYLAELENVIRKHQQMLQDTTEQHSSLEQELKSVVAKNQHMQAIYEQQDLTPADVERLRASRQELARQEENLEKEVEAIDSDIWKEEMSIARLLEQVDSSIAEYSRLARSLKLIPSSSGINFELRSTLQDLDNRLENVIMPALAAMKKKGMESIQQLESNKLKEETRLEEYAEQLNDVQEEIGQIEKDIQTTDGELECRKSLYQRDIEGLQGSVERVQQEIRTQQTSSQISLQDAEMEYREICSWAERRKVELAKKEEAHANFLVTACKLIADHKTHVQQQLKQLEKDMSSVLAQEQDKLKRMVETSQRIRQAGMDGE